MTRVSSKQTKIFFGLNRKKPKLGLFRFIFGLFRETNKLFFRFVSVRFGVSDPYRNNRNRHAKLFLNRTIMGIKNPFESVNFKNAYLLYWQIHLKQFISTRKTRKS
jgi:hypothetical protein